MDLDQLGYMHNSVVIGGLGVVGKATRKTFGIKDYYDLRGSTLTLKDVAEQKRYVFMCLPTPTKDKEQQGREDIKAIIKQIIELGGGQKIFIIRSTVLPGTCKTIAEQLDYPAIIHNPEFLTEATWEKDAVNPDIIVLGGDDHIFLEDVEGMYKARFRGRVDIIKTDTITSEMIKYAVNCFYATKVVYANQLFDIAREHGANYKTIMETMYKRKWIGKNHLRIFDEEKKRGAGGKCLGKDLDAFANTYQGELLKLVNKLNKIYLGQ